MKKHILMLMLAGLMAFTACGNKDTEKTNTDQVEESTDNTEDTATEEDTETVDRTETTDGIPIVEATVEDAGIDAFITAGEYMGIEVAQTDITASDEDIDTEISTALSKYPMVYTDAEKTVEINDTVNLDYSGSVDGVVFDGGTAEGYDLVIGSGSFIDDFEEQLVGMHVGEEGEVEVTFPEDYKAEDMAGKDAVFAVKINSISRTLDAVNDEWLAANADGKTEAEYRQFVKETLEKRNKSSAVMNNFCATVEFPQFPKDRVDYCVEKLETYYDNVAAMYGMTYEDFLTGMGATEEAVYQEAESMVRYWLLFDYICKEESVTEESEIYQQYLTEYLSGYGFATVDEFVSSGYGTEWDVDYAAKNNYVVNLITDNAKIVVGTETTEETAE